MKPTEQTCRSSLLPSARTVVLERGQEVIARDLPHAAQVGHHLVQLLQPLADRLWAEGHPRAVRLLRAAPVIDYAS